MIDATNLIDTIRSYLRSVNLRRREEGTNWKPAPKYADLLDRAEGALRVQDAELRRLRDENEKLGEELRLREIDFDIVQRRAKANAAERDRAQLMFQKLVEDAGRALAPTPIVLNMPIDPIAALRIYLGAPRSGPSRARTLRELVALVDQEARDLRVGSNAEVRFVHSRQPISEGGDESIRVEVKKDL